MMPYECCQTCIWQEQCSSYKLDDETNNGALVGLCQYYDATTFDTDLIEYDGKWVQPDELYAATLLEEWGDED